MAVEKKAIAGSSAPAVTAPLLARGVDHFDDGYDADAKVVWLEPIVRMVRVAAPRKVCWKDRVRHVGQHHWRHHQPARRHAIIEPRCEIQTHYHDEKCIDDHNVTYRCQDRQLTTAKQHSLSECDRLRVHAQPTAEYERTSSFKSTSYRLEFICDNDLFIRDGRVIQLEACASW